MDREKEPTEDDAIEFIDALMEFVRDQDALNQMLKDRLHELERRVSYLEQGRIRVN